MINQAVMGVFADRAALEKAIQALQSSGVDRSHLSLLSGSQSIEDVKERRELSSEHQQEPIDRADKGNLQGMMAGVPAYLGAVLAAGVTVASGGTLAGVAVAAVAAGGGAGALGAGAAKLFGDRIDRGYEEQLNRGGIILVVALQGPGEQEGVMDTLKSQGATHVALHDLP